MEPARCPSCHAVVASRAAWCGLCYADLRPAGGEPEAEQPSGEHEATEPAPPAAASDLVPWAVELPVPEALSVAAGPAGGPASLVSPGPAVPSPLPTHPADEPADEGEAATGWPCLSCGARVALELDSCPECGKPFLAGGDAPVSLHVPIVGDLAQANPGTRFIVGLAAGGVLCAVFIVVLLILGKLI